MGCDSSCTCEKDERERWVEAIEKLGYFVHPGISIEENLIEFAKFYANRLPSEGRKP